MSGVHLLGIRHHGPGSARSVLAALAAISPDAVLVELPAEAGRPEVLSLVADPALVPPVALLGYVTDHPERAVFYPFARFSPEWQAMRWALDRDVAVRAIDLPLANAIAMPTDRRRPPLDPIAELAAAAGDDDAERWWEDVVEHRGGRRGADDRGSDGRGFAGSVLDGFAAVAEAMAAVRAISPPAEGIEACREAAMRRAIRAARADGFTRIAVVCGAWHVPSLTGLDGPSAPVGRGAPATADPGAAGASPREAVSGRVGPGEVSPAAAGLVGARASGAPRVVATVPSAAADRATLAGLPSAKVTLTWVPWTHRRLRAESGYGAGVASPGWYAHVFDAQCDHQHWFAKVARLLRERDHQVSPDHLVAATRIADGLAALRGRPMPGLAEVTDAAEAVLGDGRRGPLDLIHDQLVVGDVLGQVPAHAPMVPLARDLAAAQKRLRLKPTADDKLLELDLRVVLASARSQLLHRLDALGIPWGRLDDGRGSSGSFRESWRLRWEPELAVRLVEASGYGTTIAAAAAARIAEQARRATALGDLTRLAEVALLAGLAESVDPILDRLAAVAADRSDAGELLDLLGPLARIRRYGDVRNTDSAALGALIDTLVARACAGLGVVALQLDDDAAAVLAERLVAANAALALIDHPARATAWVAALRALTGLDGVHGVVNGRAVRLLADAEQIDDAEVAAAFSRALSPGTPARAGAAFVEGALAGAGTVLLHDAGLLGLLDGWVTSLPADRFDEVVPLLRRTFGGFEVAERRRIGELVSGRGDGRPATPYGWDLDEERAALGLATLAAIWGVGVSAGDAW